MSDQHQLLSLRIIADENIDDDIVEFLLERGHDVVRVREKFSAGTPDQVIARAADELGAIVLTSDNHFRRLAGWSSTQIPTRYSNMGLILVPGDGSALALIRAYLDDIEANFRRAQAFDDKRLLIDMSVSGFFVRRTLRS